MTTEEQQANPPAGDNSAAPAAAAGTKVFVGNLSFKTRSKGLRDAFSQIGNVEGARVVTQGRRSMGYGFVQYASQEDAEAAVKKMHKSNLDDREINVEISTSATTLNPPGKKQPTAQSSKPKRPRKKVAKKPAPEANGEEAAPAEEKTGDEGDDAKKSTKRKPKRRPRKAKKKPAATEKKAEPKEQVVRPPKELSETVLYVSNIPFTLDDDTLKEAFAKFNPTSANVIRRKRNNLSKGFGFVNFEKEADQAAALNEMHKAKVGDREITVRKAHLRVETEESTETPGEPAAEEASN